MSALRQEANDRDSVAPFILGAVAAWAGLERVEQQMDLYRNADLIAREAIEGGPQQPADVPGASTPITTQGA